MFKSNKYNISYKGFALFEINIILYTYLRYNNFQFLDHLSLFYHNINNIINF